MEKILGVNNMREIEIDCGQADVKDLLNSNCEVTRDNGQVITGKLVDLDLKNLNVTIAVMRKTNYEYLQPFADGGHIERLAIVTDAIKLRFR